MKKYCLDCNKEKSKKGLYCKVCGYKHRTRARGLKYKLVKINPTSFKKGHETWCKSKHLSDGIKIKISEAKKGKRASIKTEFKKGNISWNTGIIWKAMRGENHPLWKGESVGYSALHSWIKNIFKKPNKCSFCFEIKPLDLANKSGLYKRECSDWIWLCRKCHISYDNVLEKSWKTRKENHVSLSS